MPLYEYQCDACGHRFEAIQKFSDAPLDTCPKCGGAVRKLQSAPAFQFKGSGWYITDYARKDQGSAGGTKEKTSGEKPSDKAEKAGPGGDAAASTKSETAAPAAPASGPASSTPTK